MAFKIGVALIAGLLTTSVYYYLVRRNVSWLLVIIACSYVTFSPLITYFILQFPKNALGLVFLILLISDLDNRKVALVFLIATLLTHRMTGGFALIIAAIYAIRQISWKWIVGGIVVLVLISLLPGTLHISDLSRFDGQFIATPHWAPAAFATIFSRSLDWFFKADLVLVTIFFLSCAVLIIRKTLTTEQWSWLVILVISIFPFLVFTAGSIGHRFFMIAPVAAFVLLVSLIQPGSGSWKVTSSGVAGAFIVLSIFSWRSYQPWLFDAPNNSYGTIVERLVKRYNPNDFPLVIAHKSLAEIIIFKTDFDALNWLPPEDTPPTSVLRLTHRVSNSDFKEYLSDEDYLKVRPIANGYFALPEDTWQRFLTEAKKHNDPGTMKRILRGNNPMEARPYFINKGRR